MAGGRRRAWFDRGCEAFKRSFPELAASLPFEQFYVCPICLHAFDEAALVHGTVTREHAPPESVGGTRVALTCRRCNSDGGSEADSDMRREADILGFANGALREIHADMETDGAQIPIRLSFSGNGISVAAVPWATHPVDHQKVMDRFARASAGADPSSLRFTVTLEEYSRNRAAASWLRSAYLLFFASLGYRFIWRPELDVVRTRIQNPDGDEPTAFRLTKPKPVPAPALCRIDTTERFRSYALLWGHHAVFLPRFSDRGLYGRLATMGEVAEASITGVQYPWPKGGPTFLYDFAVPARPQEDSDATA